VGKFNEALIKEMSASLNAGSRQAAVFCKTGQHRDWIACFPHEEEAGFGVRGYRLVIPDINSPP